MTKFVKDMLTLMFCYLAGVKNENVTIENQCSIKDEATNLCYYCGYNYYYENYQSEVSIPFPASKCIPKALTRMNSSLFVFYNDGNYSLDGSIDRPFKNLNDAFQKIEELATEVMEIEIKLIIFTRKEEPVFFWNAGGVKEYFRRKPLKLIIKPGYCDEYPAFPGCVDVNKTIIVIMKTGSFSIFIAHELNIENINFDGRDLILPANHPCILGGGDKICCEDYKLYTAYNDSDNMCGLLKRSVNKYGITALFNIEVIHDSPTIFLPLLTVRNATIRNFHPYGETFTALVSGVKSLFGNIRMTGVQIIDSTFTSGLILVLPKLIIANKSLLIQPKMVMNATAFSSSFEEISILNYNEAMSLKNCGVLLNFDIFQGAISLKKIKLQRVFLLDGCYFNSKEPRKQMGLIFEDLIFTESLGSCFISSRSLILLSISRAIFWENFIDIYIQDEGSSISLDGIKFTGVLPALAFVSIINGQVSVLNSEFFYLQEPYPDANPILFTSQTYYQISLSDQFYDADINKVFTAKDTIKFVNLNVTDSRAKFKFLDCAHSVLEVSLIAVNFCNLTINDLKNGFIQSTPEKNFSIEYSNFENISLNHFLIKLQPCIRLLFFRTNFRNLQSQKNHLIKFETRTFKNKPFHVFCLKEILLDNIKMTLNTGEYERFVILCEDRSIGDGGSIMIVDSKINNIFFEKNMPAFILFSLTCVQLVLRNISIESVSNCTVLFFSITDEGSSLEISSLNMLNEKYPINKFLNTQKEYIFYANIINCSIITNFVVGSSLITLNNVKNFRMLNNYLRSAVIDGSLLVIRVESLINTFIFENTFQGEPSLGITHTSGMIYASNKMEKNAIQGLVNSGIQNAYFKNLYSTAILVSENSEFLLLNSTFSNISSPSDSLVTLKSNSFAFFSYIQVHNVEIFKIGAVFSVISSMLIIHFANFCSCLSKTGQGGVIYGIESDIFIFETQFQNIIASLGGLILSDNCGIIIKSIFSYNVSVLSSGGCFFANLGIITIENSTFFASKASSKGGWVLSDTTIIQIKNVTIINSLAGDIGMLLIFNDPSGQSSLEELSFINNKAKSLPSLGVYDSIIKASKLYIYNNSAEFGQNIIQVLSFSPECSLFLLGAQIINNSLVQKGSLISIVGSKLVVQNGFMMGHSIPLFIRADLLSDVRVLNSSFFEKGATAFDGNGWFLFIERSTLNLENSFFSGGSKTHGLYCLLCLDLTVYLTIFRSISAKEGAIFLKRCQQVKFDSNLFDKISGTNYGVIRAENIGNLNIYLTSFVESECAIEGCASVVWVNNEISQIQANIYLEDLIVYRSIMTAIVTLGVGVVLRNSILVGHPSFHSQALNLVDFQTVHSTGNVIYDYHALGGTSFVVSSRVFLLIKPHIYFSNTTFFNCSSIDVGGAVSSLGDISIKIMRSSFINSFAANSGGSLHCSCEGISCSLIIQDLSVFSGNRANSTGGAIKLNFKNYSISDDSVFHNNHALIGDNISSTPSELHISIFKEDEDFLVVWDQANANSENMSLPSITKEISIPIGHEIKLGLFILDDFKNYLKTIDEIIVKTNISSIINTITGDAISIGTVKLNLIGGNGVLKNGSCYLPHLSLLSDIPDITVDLTLYTRISAMDMQETIRINLLRCPKGEVFLINICIPCEENFFSWDDDSYYNKISVCEACLKHAKCPGRDLMIPLNGYWRLDSKTKIIKKCINNEACIYDSEFQNRTVCAYGYTGNSCYNCKEGHGKSSNICIECFRNTIFWTTSCIGIFIFLGIIIYSKHLILKDDSTCEAEEKQDELLLKLLIHHFNYLTVISLFDLNWRDEIINVFNFANSYFSSSPQSIFVLDCFFQAPPIEKYKASFIFVCFCPVLFTIASYFTCFFLEIFFNFIGLIYSRSRRLISGQMSRQCKLIFFNYFVDMNRARLELETLFVIICLNVYPIVIMKLEEVFICVELTEELLVLKSNPEIQCWTEDHLLFLIFSTVFHLIWGLGIPTYFFYRSQQAVKFLVKNKIRINFRANQSKQSLTIKPSSKFKESMTSPIVSNSKSIVLPIDFNIRNEENGDRVKVQPRTKKDLAINFNLFLVSGYEPRFYYWESIMFLKKGLVVLVSVLINYMDKRSLTAVIISFFFVFFSVNEIWPIYNSSLIKKFEGISLVISIATISLALFASDDDVDSVPKYASLILVVAINLVFLALWFAVFFSNKFLKLRKILTKSRIKSVKK